MKRVGILGCGRLADIVAQAIARGEIDELELAGVYSRSRDKTINFAKRVSCKAAESFEELMEVRPDYVVEAATGKALREYAVPALAGKADLIVLSTGAFGDPAFYEKVREAAEEYDRHVYLASGVVGGFDIMETARMMGNLKAAFTKQKFPKKSPQGDPALRDLDDAFAGSAKEAYEKFPDHLNVAVSVALATNGVNHTPVKVETGDRVSFQTELAGDFGKALIYTELGTTGPDMAAWSVLRILQRLNSRIVF